MTTSTKYSRRLIVQAAQVIPEVRVLGLPPFRVEPAFHAEPGVYRAELDPNTGTASIRQEAE